MADITTSTTIIDNTSSFPRVWCVTRPIRPGLAGSSLGPRDYGLGSTACPGTGLPEPKRTPGSLTRLVWAACPTGSRAAFSSQGVPTSHRRSNPTLETRTPHDPASPIPVRQYRSVASVSVRRGVFRCVPAGDTSTVAQHSDRGRPDRAIALRWPGVDVETGE